jgi:hypothetical protein
MMQKMGNDDIDDAKERESMAKEEERFHEKKVKDEEEEVHVVATEFKQGADLNQRRLEQEEREEHEFVKKAQEEIAKTMVK